MRTSEKTGKSVRMSAPFGRQVHVSGGGEKKELQKVVCSKETQAIQLRGVAATSKRPKKGKTVDDMSNAADSQHKKGGRGRDAGANTGQ